MLIIFSFSILKVGNGAPQDKPPIVEGRVLQSTVSMPVWMPSTVTSTALDGDTVKIPDNKIPLQPLESAKEESVHSLHSPRQQDSPATGSSSQFS